MSWTEVCLNFDTNNKYDLFDAVGNTLFEAEEDTNCCTRQVLGRIRPFEMLVKEPTGGAEVIAVSRPLRCQGCFCPCFLQVLEVRQTEFYNGVKRVSFLTNMIPEYNDVRFFTRVRADHFCK